MKFGVLIAIAFLFLGLGAFYRWWSNQLLPVNPSDNHQIEFTVQPNETASQVVVSLSSSRLIRSDLAAKLYLKYTGLDQKIRPGLYTLSPNNGLGEIFQALTSGPADIRVTIPEGWRREQIAARVKANISSFDITDFLKRTASLEGQLFPDTYLLPANATASDVVQIFLSNFTAKTSLDLQSTYQITLGKSTISLTGSQVLALASLVEREAKHDSDRPTIAGILIKRLDQGWPLQVDATVQYAQNHDPDWWAPVTDTKFPSIYNTYLHPGLPPHPIANPGLASITAVLHPQDTVYWYYLASPDGVTHYAPDLAGHNLNIDKYLSP